MTTGIVTPPSGPDIPEKVVLVATQPDFSELVKSMGAQEVKGVPMPMRLFQAGDTAIAGPFMGAPQAVMLLENLVAWGGKYFLMAGWCGSLTGKLAIGETLLVTGAYVDEGTSLHYGVETTGHCVSPSVSQTAFVRDILSTSGTPVVEGKAWTTDAIYRETPERINRFKDLGAVAVEMESSALFTAACYRKVKLAALMTVSDDVSGLSWSKGFGTPRFKEGRKRTLGAICHLIGQSSWALAS
ncbi:nucleoside phosphorylase [Desulfoluna sp.]|uniref:nucleoside phosphorylase n=1 Tax=Desulfoluna sp. TaxID=2045199 RepID=UPI0026046153|nr:nucleoside phosphorylase [Desulfoluna sp.]